MRAQRLHAANRYLPVDELLDLPRVRVLRALRHFDWATAADLLTALDEHDDASAQAVWRALFVHVADGHVERDASSLPYRYRIVETGRAEIVRLLARGDVNEERAR